MSFSHFDVFISLWRMAERKLAVSCCFLTWFLKFYDKKYFVPWHWEAIFAQSLIWKYAFYLHVFTRCCPATSFWNNEKIKKSYWTTVTNISPYIRHTPSWWWHVMFWHCTFCIAVNTVSNKSKPGTFGRIKCVLICQPR